jgi:hypothetical protein
MHHKSLSSASRRCEYAGRSDIGHIIMRLAGLGCVAPSRIRRAPM